MSLMNGGSWWSESDSDSDVIEVCSKQVPKPKPTRIIKESSTQRAAIRSLSNQWVCSSFDDIGQPHKVQRAEKQPSTNGNQRQKSGALQVKSHTSNGFSRKQPKHVEVDDLWADKYSPETQEELAVHKKKIGEVESWISGHCCPTPRCVILLLTGPSGCGKSACVKVLTSQLGITVQEWSNPAVPAWRQSLSDYQPIGGPLNESQLAQFEDFLLRANRYESLDIFGTSKSSSKMILVEEFPNIFFRNVEEFHSILRRYSAKGHCPLVFILSDNSGSDSNARSLFPKQLQEELAISNISFNQVAQTNMVKVLSRIATLESKLASSSFSMPDKSTLESVSTSCAGDIRGAINSLQFMCYHNNSLPIRKSAELPKRARVKSKKPNKQLPKGGTASATLTSVGGKDSSLLLFRALGKILYCKRSEPSEEDKSSTPPPHLCHTYRDPLIINPEEIIEQTHLSGELFSAYLHQNYVEFLPNVEDVVTASSYISDADSLLANWTSRDSMQPYASSIVSRGLLFSNTARASHCPTTNSGMGWKPLHKPQWFAVTKAVREKCAAIEDLFKTFRQPATELQSQVLPYLALTNTTLHSPQHITFLQDLIKFPQSQMTSRRAEKLSELDTDQLLGSDHNDMAGPVNDTEDSLSNSQSVLDTSHVEDDDDDEMVIEDFDF